MKLPIRLLSMALLVVAACKSSPPPASPQSVKPGINKDFLDPALDPQKFIERFETESREIFTERAAVAAMVGLKPGQSMADIGAGTGLFTLPFAEAVGPKGRVYAVDIAPAFVERIEQLAAERGVRNVEGVVCAEDDARLPKDSIDVAFVCDTYHHFEYPVQTLASIHRALRRGGELVVVEFHRIEGVSREWCMSHVRAGQDVFVGEILAAGFERLAQDQLPGLKENYVVRFRKR